MARHNPFGVDGEGANVLAADALGVRPPGALKFVVPQGANVFEVDLTLDSNRTKQASIQALVLKQKPKSQSYIPGRYVFGGKKRPVTAQAQLKKEQERALRKRNLAEANKTKIGLNAERNVFANWDRTSIEAIGGPWPDQDADQFESDFPYHYTVPEILENATPEDLAELRLWEDRLAALASDQEESNLLALAEAIIEAFANRAWRREITAEELRMLIELYQNGRNAQMSFDSSVKSALLVVLVSSEFLYKQFPAAHEDRPSQDIEDLKARGIETVPLSSDALATRLSFFLWGSLPDDELMQLAREDRLRDAHVLEEQVERMLHDPRVRSLATDFAGQVWDFADFESFQNPDGDRFPEFTPALRAAMLQEVEAFLVDLFQNDRPLTNLLDSDYTFVNAVLANHYGIEGVDGDTFERTTVDERRGGLAGMGLFLTKTSRPLRTSPVQRGVWVLEKLLGDDLPNPPADVPPLSEDDRNAQGEDIQQQLKRHREAASCASCHNKIDPLGIALENFDPIGRWRETERDGKQLATQSILHNGVTVHGAAGLKRYLVDRHVEVFAKFNRKLLGYALGRAVAPGDRDLLEKMQRELISSNFRFSTLVKQIVTSPQFTRRREED